MTGRRPKGSIWVLILSVLKPKVQVQRQIISGQHNVGMANAPLLAASRSQCVDGCSGTLSATRFPAHRRCGSGQPSIVVPDRNAALGLGRVASNSRLPVGSGSDPAGACGSWWVARCSDGELLRMARIHGVHLEPWLTADLSACGRIRTRQAGRWPRSDQERGWMTGRHLGLMARHLDWSQCCRLPA